MTSTIPKIVSQLHETFLSRKTNSIEFRKQQLRQIQKCVEENYDALYQAFYKDLRQTKLIAKFEATFVTEECKFFIKNLDRLTKPLSKPTPIMQLPGTSLIYRQPFGVVLIISPWNYPFQLAMLPLVGAIAAGNVVCLKPSEVTPNVSKWFVDYLPKYVDNECIRIVEGGVEESTALLKQKFDYIFYTGNTIVGKIIARAAAEHLTPTTLELGGKCPAIVDSNCDLLVAAKRIAFAKWTNLGQTCVSCDTLYVHKDVQEKFLKTVKDVLLEWYGEEPHKSPDYSRIVNQRHTGRVQKYIEEEKKNVVHGGHVNIEDCFIAPTVIVNPSKSSQLSKEEIFGPILPVHAYDNIDDVITEINTGDRPLAIYVYSHDKALFEKVRKSTDSGAILFNESLHHATMRDLPFGGVGASGMGRYYGEYSFRTFTYERASFLKSLRADPSIKYPPFTENKLKWVFRLLHLTNNLPEKQTVVMTIVVIGLAVLLGTYPELIHKASHLVEKVIGY